MDIEAYSALFENLIPVLVGALVGLMGSRALAKEQNKDSEKMKTLEDNRRQTAAGHRAMLAIESQRLLAHGLLDARGKSVDPAAHVVVNVDRQSVPRLRVEEVDFLIEKAENKNILPQLIAFQQTFDQLISSLGRYSESRQKMEIATGSSQSRIAGLHREELIGISASIDQIAGRIEHQALAVQKDLRKGLEDAVKGFKPVFKPD